jgi:hypothetical protein
VGTVRVRLARARDRLRDRLTRRGFGTAGLARVQALADASAAARPSASALTAGWVEATVKAHQELGEVEALQKRVEALEKQLDRVRKHLERLGGASREPGPDHPLYSPLERFHLLLLALLLPVAGLGAELHPLRLPLRLQPRG